MVDALATLSAMVQVNERQEMTIHVQHQPRTVHCQHLSRGEYHDIKRYLKKGEYLEGASENGKRTLRRLASSFFLSGTILYKRNADTTLLYQEAKRIIEEVHEGTFDTHTNGHALARKILQTGYYWMKMESDCYEHVKR
ncbi:hypothetical protein CR513_46034, partial [Mucuna pruriens]